MDACLVRFMERDKMKHKTKAEQKQIEENLLGKKGVFYPVTKSVRIEGSIPIHLLVGGDDYKEALKKAEEMGFETYKEQQTSPRTSDSVRSDFNLVELNHWELDEDDYPYEDKPEDWFPEHLSHCSVAGQFGWMNSSEFLRAQYIMETQHPTKEWIIDLLVINEGFSPGEGKVFQISFRDFGLEHPTLSSKDRVLSEHFQGTKVGGADDRSGARFGNHYDLLNERGVGGMLKQKGLGKLFWDTFPEFQEYYTKNGKTEEPEIFYGVASMLFRIRWGEIDGVQSQVLPISSDEIFDFWKANYTEEEE